MRGMLRGIWLMDRGYGERRCGRWWRVRERRLGGCGSGVIKFWSIVDIFFPSSPLYYITALTALFESIALIMDQHQPVVEKYYWRGKMQNVVARLLEECDRIVQGLVERSIKRLFVPTNSPLTSCEDI
ncbi:hypothetical protein DFH07DRAFT_309070 [Mycena maculata]|uniref:COG4 transport protein middle alpha-helical bundle domain-containing protein n=1 Tax=Mycena maculata TaxID=230809 RepID=A0AAD7HGN9_9AGAR|nr:hypothetical protein DFH07DRAFT_309070 [Mycena maculata]